MQSGNYTVQSYEPVVGSYDCNYIVLISNTLHVSGTKGHHQVHYQQQKYSQKMICI